MAQDGSDGIDPSLMPVAVLIDELRHDEMPVRLNSIKQLGTIATALGPERTREELVPFLQELIDDDDEILVALAEQVGQGIPWVGGHAYAHTLFPPLEELCNVEEISVREKATESLRNLSKHMAPDQTVRHMCALINRLAAHDWFTSRCTVCGLFAAALPNVQESKYRDDLLKTYVRLCGDDTPMVRRQAAHVLGSIAEVVQEKPMLSEIFQVFAKLAKDEHDSVRILAINNCIVLGGLKHAPERHAQILPVVKSCAEDKSWRVRYMIADNVKQLCEIFGDTAPTAVIPQYFTLLSDQEVEVRAIAAARVADVAKVDRTPEFTLKLVGAIEKLASSKEQSQNVRASLAGSVLSLAPIFGAKMTVDHLINIFLTLIKDDSPEVRLKLIETLGELSSVVGIDVLSQKLIPSIKELGKDRQWRVRLAVLEAMPTLAKCLGVDLFTKELSSLLTLWLTDSVHSMRDATALHIRRLCDVLGIAWFETNVVPQLKQLLAHGNYLYRIATILCVGTLAESESVGPAFLDTHLVPMVIKMASDPVPNVRFNVAKTILTMHKACGRTAGFDDNLLPCLRRLVADEDPDVKFYAQKTISDIGV